MVDGLRGPDYAPISSRSLVRSPLLMIWLLLMVAVRGGFVSGQPLPNVVIAALEFAPPRAVSLLFAFYLLLP